MRDPDLMLSLLREMSEHSSGWVIMPATLGMSELEMHRRHQLELLIDSGHAVWTGPNRDIARITSAGYDFLAATENFEPVRERFLERINAGIPYLDAVRVAMDLLGRLTS